ncbi:RICIN domain-containing protein [Amycolatopsis sp. NPDC051071]|uniref:RICIN domain-containing protein n=1 Tax=Amycolatopsis sp. NPDC051071 TaxID=3154637 RepID=UPI00342596BD
MFLRSFRLTLAATASVMLMALALAAGNAGATSLSEAHTGFPVSVDQQSVIGTQASGVWIRNSYTDRCVVVPGGDNRNGALAFQYDCLNGVQDQRWRFESKGRDSEGHYLYWIRNTYTDRCLVVPGGDNRNGALAFQYDCLNGVEDQLWFLELKGADSEGHGLLWARNSYTDRCLVVPGGDNRNGAHAFQYDCLNGVEDQQWFLQG